MEKVYIPQKEKHYTLEDWMIRFVINGKITQWKEIQDFDEQHTQQSYMDMLLGRGRFPSKDAVNTCLNMLSDENLSDILLLAAMGETFDVDLNLDPDEGRFLDFYQRHPELVEDDRNICLHFIEDKKYLPAAIRFGQLLMELPKGTDISDFPTNLFDWRDGVAAYDLDKLMARNKADQNKEEESSDGE